MLRPETTTLILGSDELMQKIFDKIDRGESFTSTEVNEVVTTLVGIVFHLAQDYTTLHAKALLLQGHDFEGYAH